MDKRNSDAPAKRTDFTQGGQTRRLAEFGADLRFEDIPATVIDRAKLLVLNNLSCAVRGQGVQSTQIVTNTFMRMSGVPEATIVGIRGKVPAAVAAGVNSHSSYATMNDDSFAEGVCHPGKATVPVAFATAERERASGRDLLTAIVAAIEIGCRASAALCQSPESHKARLGWRCTIADGLFGAVAAGRLAGLDSGQLACAMGMAANASSGLDQTFPITNEWAWDAGRAAYLAILVTDFARAGMTSGTKLEGPKGHIQMFTAGRAEPALAEPRLVRGLGEEWLTEHVIVKSRTASYLVHNVIEAAYRVVIDNNVATDDIKTITLRQSAWTANRDRGWEVRDYDSAMFDTPFEIAVGLLDRSPLTLPDDIAKHLTDPRARELAGKLVSEGVTTVDAFLGIPAPATAILETKDGRSFEATAHEAMGSYPHTPFPREQFLEKVRRNASYRLDPERVEELIDAVDRLDTISDVRSVTDLLVPPPRAHSAFRRRPVPAQRGAR